MINIDISNIWGQLALQDLLGIEQEIFAAHGTLPEQTVWEDTERICQAAEVIRAQSQVCVVLGSGTGCLGARGVMEWLQGPQDTEYPRIVFAGNSLSTRQWNALKEQLEGKDFSVLVVSESGSDPESAITLRGLKWILERRYGTDESRRRIFAVAGTEDCPLSQLAADQGWEWFCGEVDSVLSPAGLLSLAAGGIDIRELLQGAEKAREEFNLRSFENPVWLYVAVRNLMHRSGKAAELLTFWEPGFAALAQWWQQRFLRTEAPGLLPVGMEYPSGLAAVDLRIRQGQQDFYEVMLRFDPSEQPHIIGYDVCDPGGLNTLADSHLDQVEEQAYWDALQAHADGGVPVVTMECGARDARTVGELLFFAELSSRLSSCIPGKIL